MPCVYQIIDNLSGECIYIGSTRTILKNRIASHKCRCNTLSEIPLYQYIRQIGWENITIESIYEQTIFNMDELLLKERQFILELAPTCNVYAPIILPEEFISTHNHHSRISYYRHRDEIAEKDSVKNICKCGGKFTNGNRLTHNKTIKHNNYLSSMHGNPT